jgi:hypothetical protein
VDAERGRRAKVIAAEGEFQAAERLAEEFARDHVRRLDVLDTLREPAAVTAATGAAAGAAAAHAASGGGA